MRAKIDQNLRGVYAECTGVQIIKVEFQKDFEAKLVDIQVSDQRTIQATFESETKQIVEAIKVDTSEAETIIQKNRADAAATALAITSAVDADIQSKTIRNKADTYKLIQDVTGQTPADTLMDYIYYTNILTSLKNPERIYLVN
jgi:hypothetical protein